MVNRSSLLLVVSALVLPIATGGAPTTTIEGRLVLPDDSPFNQTTRISLNYGQLAAYSRYDGSFSVYDVPPGIHSLDVDSLTHHFSQIKIQVLEDDIDSPKCLEYAYPGATKNAVQHPLKLTAYATYDYFETRQGFSIFSMLRNPMFLMMAFGALLMFYMPKMMEGLDPEEREQMRQQMEMQQDPTKMLSSFFGGEQPAPKRKKKSS